MILEIEVMKDKLNKKILEVFSNCDQELVNRLQLLESTLSDSELKYVESTLEISLPNDFYQMVLKYEFGGLIIGSLTFGYPQKYSQTLIDDNDEDLDYPWWGTNNKRPMNFLRVAGTDGWVVLLDTNTGKLYAFLRTSIWERHEFIAPDFNLFVCAMGTIYLATQSAEIVNRTALYQDLDIEGNSQFWQEVCEGYA